MSLMLGLVLMYVGLLWAAVIWILKLAADKEYPYWAPRLAERLIRTVSLLLPRLTRAQRREEWLAELDAARAEGGVLTFGLFEVLPAAPRVAVVDTWHHTDWRSALTFGLANGLGVGGFHRAQ